MKRYFCLEMCALLCCVLLLGISACTRQDFPSSEPPVESQQTEATAETMGENGQEQKSSKDETYHLKETSTHDNIEEIVDNVFRSDDDSFVEGTYERRYSERYTVKGTRVANDDGTFTQTGTITDEDGHLESSWELVYADGDASNAPRNADMIIQQDAYGNIVSVCGSNETQNEDINPEYFTENWIDDRKPYNTHQVEDRNINMISFRDLMNLYDGNGDLIRVFDDSFVWNDDGSITSTNSTEYFQDYDGCSKGYKVRVTSKDWADGTTSELISYFTEQDGSKVVESTIRNDDGAEETWNIKHYDEKEALIWFQEVNTMWNADGSTTRTDFVEYLQDYEDILKGYKMNQITKTKADGTTYEFHEEYTYPDGICYKSGFTTNANGAKENYFEEWKDGKKVSK